MKPAAPPALRGLLAVPAGGIFALLLALVVAGPAAAGPLAGEMAGLPEKIVVGEPFSFELKVTNQAAEDLSKRVKFSMPTALRHAARPDCAWRYEPENRAWIFDGLLPPGETTSCRITLIATENPGAAFLTLELQTFVPTESYDRVEREVPLVSPPDPGVIQAGDYELSGGGLAALAFLALIVAVLGLLRLAGRQPTFLRLAPVVVACVGFLAYFALMAASERRALTEFHAASCEVLDREAPVSVQRADRPGREETRSYDARLVVAYELAGRRTVAVAGRPDSFLDLSADQAAELFAQLEQGKTIPCWVDPENERHVLIARGYGGAYLFALIPLAGLALILFFSRRGA